MIINKILSTYFPGGIRSIGESLLSCLWNSPNLCLLQIYRSTGRTTPSGGRRRTSGCCGRGLRWTSTGSRPTHSSSSRRCTRFCASSYPTSRCSIYASTSPQTCSGSSTSCARNSVSGACFCYFFYRSQFLAFSLHFSSAFLRFLFRGDPVFLIQATFYLDQRRRYCCHTQLDLFRQL